MTVIIYDEKGLREVIKNVFDICYLPDDKMHLHFHTVGEGKRHTYYIPLINTIKITF